MLALNQFSNSCAGAKIFRPSGLPQKNISLKYQLMPSLKLNMLQRGFIIFSLVMAGIRLILFDAQRLYIGAAMKAYQAAVFFRITIWRPVAGNSFTVVIGQFHFDSDDRAPLLWDAIMLDTGAAKENRAL